MWSFGNERMRCVLVICYDFPAIYAAGVIRTYQLARSLSRFGWQPVILTAQECVDREANIEASDGALGSPKITAAASRFLVPSQIDHRPTPKQSDHLVPTGDGPFRRLSRIAARLAVPDGKIGWLYPAVKRGLQIAHAYPIQVCFSVSPRPTAHLVAYRLARRLNIPWVADFALPWSDAHWLLDRPRFIGSLDQRVEGLVVRSAQHVTVAYVDLARNICARYGPVWQEKLSVIPTGYEDDLFAQQSPPSPSKFTVVYPGNHFCEEGRDGEYFLKAVDEWIDHAPRLKDEVELVFIGKRDDALLRHRLAMAHPEVVRIEPLMSHRECIRAILAADACVVNTVGNRIPAKIYECMRAGKWVLALTDAGSDLEHLTRSYAKGLTATPRDISTIKNTLQSTLQRCNLNEPNTTQRDSFLQEYSSKHSAETLSHIFNTSLTRTPITTPLSPEATRHSIR